MIKRIVCLILLLSASLNILGVWAQSGTGYAFNRKPLVQSAYAELPLGSIKAKGWLLKQLELQRNGATGHAEELYPESQNLGPESDWLGGSGQSWERVPYYVKGLTALAYTLDDKELKARAEKWISWTINSQQANGLFGPPEMDDWWPRMPMMYALKNYYEASGDKRIIGFLTKYFKYQLKMLPEKPLRDWSKSRTGDNIEMVLWLYNKTGEKFLLNLADTLKKQAYPWKDIFLNNAFYHFGDDFHTKHAVSVGQALKFPAVYYQKSKDHAYQEAFFTGIEHLIRDHGQPSGVASGTEFLAGKSSIQGVETCTVVEWMQSLETAARIFEDASIGDRLEKIAFNALPAQFSRDIKEHLYYSQPNQVRCKYGNVGFDEDYTGAILLSPYSGMGCCRYNMHMGWPYFVKNSWAATIDKGLAVIAYAPVEVNAVAAGNVPVKIAVETNYPFEEQIKMLISVNKPAAFPLKLRIPAWCKRPEVRVNGKVQTAVKSGEIYTINRQWRDKDEVILNFPMEINFVPQVNSSVSVERGPLVYALQMETDYFAKKEHSVKGFYDYEVFPKTSWNYALVLHKAKPAGAVEVKKYEMPDNPFEQAVTPVKLKVKAKKIPSWGMSYNGMYADEVPFSPVASNEPLEEITLVPFGSENIRISCFPQIGIPLKESNGLAVDFENGKMSGWVYYGGGWYVKDGALHTASNAGSWGSGIHGSKAVYSGGNFSDFTYEADISVNSKGNAGLIFRVSKPGIGAEFYEGYYAGLNPSNGTIEVGKASDQRWTILGSSKYKLEAGRKYHVKIEAAGADIRVFVDDMKNPLIEVRDAEFSSGAIGLRSYDAIASADNIYVKSIIK